MFKKGDKVRLVDARYAEQKHLVGGLKAPVYEKKKGLVGEVVEDVCDKFSFMSVLWENNTNTTAYTWRFELVKEEWVLAPEGYEFKVGQEVKIGELVDESKFKDRVGVARDMQQYVGSVFTIQTIGYNGRIDHHDYWWNPRWLMIRNAGAIAVAPKHQKGDKVVVCKNAIIKGGPKWIEEQDACLNEEGVITAIDEKAKIKMYQINTPSGEWWYCEEAFKKTADFLRNGGKLKRNEAAIKANLDEAVETWLKKARKESGKSCCDFAVFTLKDKGTVDIKNNLAAPCHASLHLWNYKGEVVGAVDFPCFGAAKDNEDWDLYADYIINRSPFRIGFHPTPIEEVKENGVRLNVDATADQVAGACVALRHGTEWVGHMQQFAWLVKQGMDENAAWLSAFLVIAADKDHTAFQKAQIGGGHQVICGGMPQDVIFKFLKHGYPDLKKKPYREATNYVVNGGIGYDAYRKGPGENPLSDFRSKNIKETVTGTGWHQVAVITKESVIAFTKLIHEHIQKA